MFESTLNFLRLLALETLFKSLLLFLVAGIALLLLRRASASARSLVFRLTLFGLLLLPGFSLVLPPLPITLSLAGYSIPRHVWRPAAAVQVQSIARETDTASAGASDTTPESVPAPSVTPDIFRPTLAPVSPVCPVPAVRANASKSVNSYQAP